MRLHWSFWTTTNLSTGSSSLSACVSQRVAGMALVQQRVKEHRCALFGLRFHCASRRTTQNEEQE